MSPFIWNDKKNKRLIKDRKVSFDEVVSSIEKGQVLDLIENPNAEKYRGQWVLVMEIRKYAYPVPFEQRGDKIFLITVIPSRKMTRKYLLLKNGGGNGQTQ